jgi:hypothetical protein
MEKVKKPGDRQDSGILLTPGSSRRKMAWKRLRGSKPQKGLTQNQVSYYLESFMKQHYQKVRKEGALTFDKVQRYLDYLAKVASTSVKNISLDQKGIADYSETIKPVINDVGTRSAITDAEVERHSKEIRDYAQQYIMQIRQPVGEQIMVKTEKKTKEETRSSQATIESVADQGACVKEENDKDIVDKSLDTDDILTQEIVPVGFEEGAPKVSFVTFLSFPLAREEAEPDSEHVFEMHMKYLDMAVKESCLEGATLDAAKPLFKHIPFNRYSKYFDIFPEGEYDDAQLMLIYIQWRNKTLNRFLIEEEGDI